VILVQGVEAEAMRNLAILHLESVSWRQVAAFPSAFPNLHRFFSEARVYDWCISSATSTQMVVTHLFFSNDYVNDQSPDFAAKNPLTNNPDLFSILRRHGYRTDIICLNVIEPGKVHLVGYVGMLPSVWVTGELPKLVQRFDALTNDAPFAIHVWNLNSHIEQSLPFASAADGLTDQITRAYAMADGALGELLSVLERKGMLESTTFVVYGDHGDDQWTHGFKGGMIHGTEPYTQIVHVPLAIRDPGLPWGRDDGIASTVDIVPTCLQLLGAEATLPFRDSGQSLLAGAREFAFSQNFFAAQPDNQHAGIRKAFSVTDRVHTLLVSSRGLEFFAHRLDPGNHCNLLNFFGIDDDGGLAFRGPGAGHEHFRAALKDNPRALARMSSEFRRLRAVLRAKVASKRAFLAECGAGLAHALDPGRCDAINRDGLEAFFASGVQLPPDAGGRNRRSRKFPLSRWIAPLLSGKRARHR
jgi:hypothetical protein